MMYLGQPYTLYVDRDAAYVQACRAAGLLIRAGIDVFSPIIHGHPLVEEAGFPVEDTAFWERINRPFMKMCGGLIVLRLNGWRQSEGLHAERVWFHAQGRSVVFMDPGSVPEELLPPESDREMKYG